MKTLILFATKHGCTEKAALALAQHLQSADVVNIADHTPDMGDYADVIIGSSIYVGQINKALSQWLSQNTAALQQKRLGLFVCCGQAEKAMEQLAAAFPGELVQTAVAKGYFGYDFTRLSFGEKLICKAIGAPIGQSELRTAEIDSFAAAFTCEA